MDFSTCNLEAQTTRVHSVDNLDSFVYKNEVVCLGSCCSSSGDLTDTRETSDQGQPSGFFFWEVPFSSESLKYMIDIVVITDFITIRFSIFGGGADVVWVFEHDIKSIVIAGA